MQLSLSPTRHNLYIAVKNTVVSINEFSLSQTIAPWLSRMHFQTRMHSSRMRTFRNSSHLLAGGVSSTPPQEQAPPGRRHYPPEQAPPSQEQAPPWRPAARHAGIPPPLPPVNTPIWADFGQSLGKFRQSSG